jgi:2,4-dienoyl-CoA reductase-like NADH-dependent reductase (Old Yellow Enzyme family)
VGSEGSVRAARRVEPLPLGEVTARNRSMVSPMCQYCAEDGVPNEWHFVHLGSRAVGGAGIVMTEATAVEPEGRITPFDLGLWNDIQESEFSRIASFVRRQGAIAGIQLAHAGRKASHSRPWEGRVPLQPEEGGWEVVGPSPIPWDLGDPAPRELNAGEISILAGKFRTAAKRALAAGFQLLEIHAAHGYLFHSFLSPVTNQRRDGYGGDFNGRSKFLLEAVKAIREVWPLRLPLFVRVSATDRVDEGWTVNDTVRLARLLQAAGVDAIDCSSGGLVPGEQIRVYPGYQVPLAETVRRESGVKTVAVGLIREPALAEEIIANHRADLVAVGRMSLWDPYWPIHAEKALRGKAALPVQYARAEATEGMK